MSAFVLPEIIEADGRPLALGNGPGEIALQEATVGDWIVCLRRAASAYASGGKTLRDGTTWEEGLAELGAMLLRRAGNDSRFPARGRPAGDRWTEDVRRLWVEAVFAVADEPARHAHHEVTPGGLLLETPSTSVWMTGRRVHVDELPRSTRPLHATPTPLQRRAADAGIETPRLLTRTPVAPHCAGCGRVLGDLEPGWIQDPDRAQVDCSACSRPLHLVRDSDAAT